jgi:2-polyprenyl-6-methoxyphenol hydroxylase-like FAD-dependent oxidoreductase
VFPQCGGRVRLYLFYDVADKRRLVGKDKQQKFLDGFRLESFPGSETLASARPAGPCGAHPMNDTWVDQPAAAGVVLVGDAAGWSDPILGEGLSVALRDVRSVTDALRGSDDWSPEIFAEYAEERAERMRRLRFCADVLTTYGAEFVPGSVERRRLAEGRFSTDPELFMLRACIFVGPELGSAELFSDETKARLFAPA